MATRAVRLDEESERILEEIRKETGLSASGALKHGLVVARSELRAKRRAFELYEKLDLGKGGYAIANAANAKEAIAAAIGKKHRR